MAGEQQTKLELIRIEGICKMLLKKIDEETLSNFVTRVTRSKPQNVKKTIYRLSRSKLIKIIKLASNYISSDDINEAYEQYRYGLKPGFTLFCISNNCLEIDCKSAYKLIDNKLRSIRYSDDETIKSIAIKSYNKVNDLVIEFSFSYLKKYSYLTEKEEPAYIYEYEECFSWIDTQNAFLAIKNVPNKVLITLKRVFSDAYGADIINIRLTKKLIHDVFGNDKIKKGSFIKPDASQCEIEKITIADSNFSKKQPIQDSISGHSMTGTYLNEVVGEDVNKTLGINCEKGCIYLTSNVSATVFREWSVQRISAIISYLKDNANYLEYDLFHAKNIMDLQIWSKFSKIQKKLIERICYSIYVASHNNQECAPVSCSALEIKNKLNDQFHCTLLSKCNRCDEKFFPRCSCGKPDLSISKHGVICKECGIEPELVTCECGHEQPIEDLENILCLYPESKMMRLISQTFKSNFDIDLYGSFYINDGILILTESTKGGIITPDDIFELRDISNMSISDSEYSKCLFEVQKLKEKCSSMNNQNCNNCDRFDEKICIMKIFTTYPNYRPSPHQANEFGDVSFTVTIDENQYTLVGIAKSAQNRKDVLNVSENPSREMIQQVLSSTHDSRIDIIAAICPMRFSDQLVEELRYIAKLTNKMIVILDDRFMTKQYAAYLTSK